MKFVLCFFCMCVFSFTAKAELFSTPNIDAKSGISFSRASKGPKLHFYDAYQRSYDFIKKSYSQYSIETAFRKADREQKKHLEFLGVESLSLNNNHIYLLGASKYLEIAKFCEKGGSPELYEEIENYDNYISNAKKDFPAAELKYTCILWSDIKDNAQKAELKYRNSRYDWDGHIGRVAGLLAALLNPFLNPLYFIVGLMIVIVLTVLLHRVFVSSKSSKVSDF